MTGYQSRSAEDRRTDMAAKAQAMGVDRAFVSQLVDTFYGHIREDALLGPVFETAISDWDPHLATMKRFWGAMTFGTGEYDGRPLPKHHALPGLQPHHFNRWLSLFDHTLQTIAPTPEARTFYLERANRVAQSFQFALFGLDQLGPPRRPVNAPNT